MQVDFQQNINQKNKLYIESDLKQETMMSYEQVLYEIQDGIAKITFNRPDKLNAWTPQMGEELYTAMQAADNDPNVKVIVLTGAGRAFCAGADMEVLSWVLSLDLKTMSEEEVQEQFFPSRSDLRFVSESARLSTAFSVRGLVAENGLAWLMPRLIGLPRALDLLISGRTIDGKEAYEMGLVNQVVSEDQLEESTMSYAKNLADRCSPRSMRLIKKQVYDGLLGSLDEATNLSNKETILSFGSASFKEGVAHFLENRPPLFPEE